MKPIFEGKKLLVFENDGWEFAERKKGKSAVVILAENGEGVMIDVKVWAGLWWLSWWCARARLSS